MASLSFLNTDDLSIVQVADTSKMIAQQGVCLRLHIGRWTATASPTLDELGFADLDPEEKKRLRAVWQVGKLSLLPPNIEKALGRIQRAGYENKDRYCFRLESLRIDFLPAIAYESWKARNDQFRKEYMQLANHISQNWHTIIEERMKAFAANAETIYRKNNVVGIPFENWKINYLMAIRTRYPSAQEMIKQFSWHHTMTHVPFAFEQPTGASGAMGELQDQVAAQHNSVLAGFLGEIQGQFYGLISRTIQNAKERIKTNEHLPGMTAQNLRNVIEHARALNVFEDQLLEDRMNALRGILDAMGDGGGNIDTLNRELSDLEDLLKIQLVAADRVTRMGKKFDSTDIQPKDELQRQAKRNIETPDLDTEIQRKVKPIPHQAELQIEAV